MEDTEGSLSFNSQEHLVIGLGEVGSGLQKVLECKAHDPVKGLEVEGEFKFLHIAIPYFDGFTEVVLAYKTKFKGQYVVVHSTVPVGTCSKIGAVHSPIRGVHPNIDKGILTFTKFFGGPKADLVAYEFEKLGIKVQITDKSDTTEAAKLWDTTQYGAMILLNKEIKDYCDKHGLDFDIVYTEFNKSYNEGYEELGRKEVARPYLKYVDGKIGGHCVYQNSKLLDSKTAEAIRSYQEHCPQV